MALKATIFKAAITVSDLDRHHYQTHALTLARHPSETDERMMVRLLAFALHADDALQFGKGLSTEDEPDLWRKDLTGTIELWIDVGQPDEKRVRKAAGRAAQVVIYSYGGARAELWHKAITPTLERTPNVTVRTLPATISTAMAQFAQRTMSLTCTIQDGTAWITDGGDTVAVILT